MVPLGRGVWICFALVFGPGDDGQCCRLLTFLPRRQRFYCIHLCHSVPFVGFSCWRLRAVEVFGFNLVETSSQDVGFQIPACHLLFTILSSS